MRAAGMPRLDQFGHGAYGDPRAVCSRLDLPPDVMPVRRRGCGAHHRPRRGRPTRHRDVTRMLGRQAQDPFTAQLPLLEYRSLLLLGESDSMGPKASQITHEAIGSERSQPRGGPDAAHRLRVDVPEVVTASFDTGWTSRL